jgi:hypothetical protein
MKPCDIVAGIPVIPRFGLTQNCHNDILVAALLRQPIVPMTHHQAFAGGFGLLDDTAAFVNSLGGVAWGDMTSIARSLYSHRHSGRVLSVRMWSKRISVRVPHETSEIHVERPWLEQSNEEPLYWRGSDRSWMAVPSAGIITVPAGATVEIASGRSDAHRAHPRGGSPRLAAVARRFLTEARDRALPSIHRIAQR